MSQSSTARQPDSVRFARSLVVEDDVSIRTLVTTLLQRQGFHVDAAGNGVEALEFLACHEYSVVVLDLSMPEMSGEELIDRLREHDPRTLQRVVVVTAALERLRHRLPEGVCKVLTKPFDVEVFKAAVADCAGTV